jgi:poly-gamma-glutamate capsule biosynthesis protein CapA/YwtB (metallophosphatase superfamily)
MQLPVQESRLVRGSRSLSRMSNRREFLQRSGIGAIGLLATQGCSDHNRAAPERVQVGEKSSRNSRPVTLFLCGDVMTGRGVDQVLPHPGNPRLYERRTKSARWFVELAEKANGPIPKPVSFSYIWGDALDELQRVAPDFRIINLETSITTSEDRAPKGINYRMHPANTPCITVAKIDCCVLANNHVLDWGRSGLMETLETLQKASVKTAGAGRNLAEAQAPATMELSGEARVIVFAFGATTSGIPEDWAATGQQPGVDLLPDLSDATVGRVAHRVRSAKRRGDVVVASLHWGGNWGYYIPRAHRAFAHRLVDDAGVDIVHGHSSHHPKGIEVYHGKPILYGCGDLLNDYEGIGGREAFRTQLKLMYFLTMDAATGDLLQFDIAPLEIKQFRLHRAAAEDAQWLRDMLRREGRWLGAKVELTTDNRLRLRWR